MVTAIRVRGLSKHFGVHKHALKDINLEIRSGEMVALIGASGSGKSTLMRHIAGLVCADAQSESLIEVNGRIVQRAGVLSRQIRQIRAQVGMVFQQFNLVNRLSVQTNVLSGLLHRISPLRSHLGWFNASERAQALHALDRVGIAGCHLQRASTLSGGQQQRAAIARTLVQGAEIVLADEPIASLDPESSRKVMEILSRINREDGVTVLVTLHQVDVALQYCPRVIALRDGAVVFDGASTDLTPAMLGELYGMQVQELSGVTGTLPIAEESPQRVFDRADAELAVA